MASAERRRLWPLIVTLALVTVAIGLLPWYAGATNGMAGEALLALVALVVALAWPQLDRVALTVGLGVALGVANACAPTPADQGAANALALSAIVGLTFFGAFALGLSMSDARPAPERRPRLVVASLVLALLGLALAVPEPTLAGAYGFLIERAALAVHAVLGIAGLAWWTRARAPSSDRVVLASIGLFALVVGAACADAFLIDVAPHYGCDAPPRYFFLFRADDAYRATRALAVMVAMGVAPSIVSSIIGRASRTVALVVIGSLFGAAIVLARQADVGPLVRTASQCAIDPSEAEVRMLERVHSAASWSAVQCERRERLVIDETSARWEGDEDLAIALDRRARLFTLEPIHVAATLHVTIGRVLAVLDPDATRQFRLVFDYVARSPFAWMSPLARTHPTVVAGISVWHGGPSRSDLVVADDVTFAELYARARPWRERATPSFHTAHSAE